MNSSTTNIGGWPASQMRTYLNNIIYNYLPMDLQNEIVNTTVVSGHESRECSNFISTDKLYLLSTKEVWGKEGNSNVITDDTAESETRQLDYYKNNGVTTSNYSGAIKQFGGSNTYWWLRSAYYYTRYDFFRVGDSGNWNFDNSHNKKGISPAFRIS